MVNLEKIQMSEEIHLSVADTVDLKPINVNETYVFEVIKGLFKHPGQIIVNWNYKGAILSGAVRAPIFLFTYLAAKESLGLALGAAFAQFIFRFVFAGVSGAMIQSFRRVEPPWKALLSILLILPIISHIFEFIVQFGFAYITSTSNLTGGAIARSICLSIISALFTLFIMRRNVMIVRDSESKSLLNDIFRLPLLIFQFIAFIPNELALLIRHRQITSTIAGFIGFGIFSQMICWIFTSKAYWTYSGGKEITMLKYWAIDGMILMIFAVALSLVFTRRGNENINH